MRHAFQHTGSGLSCQGVSRNIMWPAVINTMAPVTSAGPMSGWVQHVLITARPVAHTDAPSFPSFPLSLKQKSETNEGTHQSRAHLS